MATKRTPAKAATEKSPGKTAPARAQRKRSHAPEEQANGMSDSTHPNGGVTDAPTMEVSSQEIQLRAYLLWEAAGKPQGQDGRFWLQAEQELKQR
jgi:hypothetical protein